MRVVERRSSAPSRLLFAGVLLDEVHVVGLVEGGDRGKGVVEEGDQIRKSVPEEAADPDGDVDPRPAELLERDHLEARHPPRLLVPDGSDAEQGEYLGDVVALRPHGRRAPDHDADALRIPSSSSR